MVQFNPYAVDLVAGSADRYLVTCRGAEVGTASCLDEAALLAAADAIAAYPEAGSDLLAEVASGLGRPLAEVVGGAAFLRELAGAVAADWADRLPPPPRP